MLQFLRTKAKHFGFFLFGIIIIAFVFWVPGGLQDEGGNTVVARVGDVKIALNDFWIVYDNAEDRARQQADGSMEPEQTEQLKLDVLAGLIHEAALLQMAEQEGITATNREVEEAIRSEQAFWKDGAFDPQLFEYLIRQNRMDRKFYINARKREIIKEKVLSLADTTVSLSPDEEAAVDMFMNQNEDVSIDDIKRQLLLAKQDSVRLSFSEGIKSEFFTTYDLELIKNK